MDGKASRRDWLRTSSRCVATVALRSDRCIGIRALFPLDVATLCEVPAVLRSTSRRTDPSAFFKDPSLRCPSYLSGKVCCFSLRLPPRNFLSPFTRRVTRRSGSIFVCAPDCFVAIARDETECHPVAGASSRRFTISPFNIS